MTHEVLTRPPQRLVPWLPVALAASLLIIASTVLSRHEGSGRHDSTRDVTGEVTRSGGRAPSRVPPGPLDTVRLAGARTTFVWHPVAGAEAYDIEVVDGDGRVVLAQHTLDTALTVDLHGRLRATRASWWVRARLPGGGEARTTMAPVLTRP